MTPKIPTNLTLTNFALALSLIVTGCTTVANETADKKSANNKSTTQVVQTKTATVKSSMSEREKLVDLLIQGFVVDEYMNTFGYTDVNCSPTNKINQALQSQLMKNIEPLSNAEVQSYINFLNNGGLSLSKKYHSTVYKFINNLVTKSLLEEDGIYFVSEESLKNKLANSNYSYTKMLTDFMILYYTNLSPTEINAMKSMDKLPNNQVLRSVFPIYQNQLNLTQSNQLISNISKTYSEVCK